MEKEYYFGRKPSPFDIRDYNLASFVPAGLPDTGVTYSNWEFKHEPLDQSTTPHCFQPGTLVRMGDGSSKAIETMEQGDKVLSAEGNICRVIEVIVIVS